MVGRWLSGIAGLAMVVSVAPRAHAEDPLVASSGTVTPVLTRPSLLPPAPRLQLSWPIQPLSFSFHGSEEGNYAAGPLRLFRAEATWLRLGRLSLVTTSAADRAFELECQLTCQPVVNRSMAVEGRLHLFSTRAVPEAHAFARFETRWSEAGSSPPRFSATRGGLLRVGLGGLLDL
jgi:hypothetical protein